MPLPSSSLRPPTLRSTDDCLSFGLDDGGIVDVEVDVVLALLDHLVEDVWMIPDLKVSVTTVVKKK